VQKTALEYQDQGKGDCFQAALHYVISNGGVWLMWIALAEKLPENNTPIMRLGQPSSAGIVSH
jgi:hypothetical protein